MLRNYQVIGVRELRKRKGFSFINIFVLAMGMPCFFLIFILIRFELSFDDFHENRNNICRANKELTWEGAREVTSWTPYEVGRALREEFPEVADAARLYSLFNINILDKSEGNTFFKPRHILAEPTFEAESVTVPLHIEGNRAFVDLTFSAADGSKRSARFWIDTGGGGFLLTETLARDLGLKWGKTWQQEGKDFARVLEAPEPFLGEFPLEIVESRVFVIVGSNNMLPTAAPGRAEGKIPGHVLARYHVVFDYPNRLFILARPGVVQPIGEPLPMPVSDQMGFPRTEVEVAGVPYGFLLDTGASFTMVSEAILKAWGDQYPEWPRYNGAAGDAVTLGGQTLETMFVPGAHWGTYEIREFGVVSQQEGVFERGMSRMMTDSIVGALGGNVLKHFRIELDYAKQVLYLSQSGPASR